MQGYFAIFYVLDSIHKVYKRFLCKLHKTIPSVFREKKQPPEQAREGYIMA